jgi:valyl-tRNA synthetase
MPKKEKTGFAKTYIPKDYEQKVYEKWESSGAFNPDNLDLDPSAPNYSIVMPPPNVTGTLHMGHAGMLAYEDILIRFHRLKGFRTLWLPGTDHAAIATQTKVEKNIKEEGLSRHSLGREKFLAKVDEFAQKSHDTIENQIKKMGSSCDWSREAFTLDETRNKAVNLVFKLMYEDALIYRGERVVNWCPRCHSTLADDEVEHEDKIAKLYTFKYSKDFPISIATTRPETKLGDTAVAVNPKDQRYTKFIGKTFQVDFLGTSLEIKIIADREIDMEFGTGALGVTPAHSMVDWQMAENNELKITKVINEAGEINKGFGDFSDKSTLVAREMIVKKLKEAGLLQKEEEIQNAISLCYRCDTPIEPLPSLQWFIDVNKKSKRLDGKSIKEISIEAVKSGVFGKEKINIIPLRFEKNYFSWMNDLRDWCISRQIWYGHRVPVWYKNEEIFVGEYAPEEEGWVQDEDTLDTWFSSGMWTFSTLATNPDQIEIKDGKIVIDSADFKNFHPTSVLETGYDILFFWVARMIIMTTFATKDIPFQDVYLHGLVLDENGKKMSKSKGNVIDPLDMIKKFGTDATRLSLIIGSTPGKDLRLSEEKIESCRNFVNKLWNISRYIIETVGIDNGRIDSTKLTAADKSILQETKNLVVEITANLETYQFSRVGELLREFTWNELADWYLEATKFDNSSEKKKILTLVLSDILKLWHPFIPFVTEAIWEQLNNSQLMTEKWPLAKNYTNLLADFNDKELFLFNKTKEVISAVRNIRAEYRVAPDKKIKVIIYAGNQTDFLGSQATLIKSLRTGIDKLTIKETGEKIPNAVYASLSGIEIYIPLGSLVDAEKEKIRLDAELVDTKKYLSSIEKKLQNKSFVENAPEEIIVKEKEKAKATKEKIEKIITFIQQL